MYALVPFRLQVSPLRLLPLNSFKQTLEVTRSKPVKFVPLDDLDEHRRPIHQRLGEQLQQISLLIIVNQDIQPLQRLKLLLQLPVPLLRLEAVPHRLVVRVGYVDELDASGPHGRDGRHDILGQEGDVLDAGARVKDDVLLDLGAFLAGGGLVDGHLDDVVGRRHDDGGEGRVVGADLAVVDGPEAVEGEALLVEGASRDHLVPVLVADAVVDAGEFDGRHLDRGGGGLGGAEARKEGACVVGAGDEGVRGVAVGTDHGCRDMAVLLV